MLPLFLLRFRIFATSRISAFTVSSDMEYINQVGDRSTGLFLAQNDRTEYSVKKIARKRWKTANKSYKFFYISQTFLKILKFSKHLGNFQISQKISGPDICVKVYFCAFLKCCSFRYKFVAFAKSNFSCCNLSVLIPN